MHPFILLGRSYSALLSSSSSSDETNCGDQQLVSLSQAPSSGGPRTIHRHSFLIRLIIFILLKFGFIALVFAALWKPIILHLSFTTTELKSAVTAIAILWHALAVFVVKDILLHIFSAEWIRQDDGSSSLTLHKLDIVSRLTMGFVDQAKHFVSKRATASFRLGFLSILLLMLLNGLGPSAIGVNFAPYNFPSNISVANLTIGVLPNYSYNWIAAQTTAHRATEIMQVEMMGTFTTLGYRSTPPNILIPWPSSDAIPANGTMTYESDVIQYSYGCSWVIPSFSNFSTPVWKFGDAGWMAQVEAVHCSVTQDPDESAVMESVLVGLTRYLVIVPLHVTEDTHILGDPFSPDADGPGFTPISWIMFIGGNATMNTVLNLEDVPSLIAPCDTTFYRSFSPGFPGCNPLLVSFLECNPKVDVLPATINATASSLEATILPGAPTLKNIPILAANTIFSSSLYDAISENAVGRDPVNSISKRLFLPDLQSEHVKPLSLQEINHNMNNVLAISAKAYLGGYMPSEDSFAPPSWETVDTSAIMVVQQMDLVGSKPSLVALGVIVGLSGVLLSVLVTITCPDELECFDLENIIKRLQ